jgi:hypothetical protein
MTEPQIPNREPSDKDLELYAPSPISSEVSTWS